MRAFNMFLSHLGIGNSRKKVSFEVSLKSKKQIAEGTYEFVFEKPADFSFKAGQHVRMTLLNPSETDKKGNSRFLTLASTPQDKDLILAMRMTDSAFKRVLRLMKIGEKVLMQILLGVSHGAFALHEDSSRPAVFLVGGIGIVPAYSMIKDATKRKLAHKIFLFYANRRPEDAPYLDELQEFEKRNSNFKLIATMTRSEKSKKNWEGETGTIDKPMLLKYIADLNSPIYYIAGLSGMVSAMKALVKDLGVAKDNVKTEDFDGMKMGQMNDIMVKIKKHIMPIVITLIVILGVGAHVGVGFSMFNSVFLKNLSYITIGLILVIIAFKVFVIFKIKQKLRPHAVKRGN